MDFVRRLDNLLELETPYSEVNTVRHNKIFYTSTKPNPFKHDDVISSILQFSSLFIKLTVMCFVDKSFCNAIKRNKNTWRNTPILLDSQVIGSLIGNDLIATTIHELIIKASRVHIWGAMNNCGIFFMNLHTLCISYNHHSFDSMFLAVYLYEAISTIQSLRSLALIGLRHVVYETTDDENEISSSLLLENIYLERVTCTTHLCKLLKSSCETLTDLSFISCDEFDDAVTTLIILFSSSVNLQKLRISNSTFHLLTLFTQKLIYLSLDTDASLFSQLKEEFSIGILKLIQNAKNVNLQLEEPEGGYIEAVLIPWWYYLFNKNTLESKRLRIQDSDLFHCNNPPLHKIETLVLHNVRVSKTFYDNALLNANLKLVVVFIKEDKHVLELQIKPLDGLNKMEKLRRSYKESNKTILFFRLPSSPQTIWINEYTMYDSMKEFEEQFPDDFAFAMALTEIQYGK